MTYGLIHQGGGTLVEGIPLNKGWAKGKLLLEAGEATLQEAMKFHPQIESMLREIEGKGWMHLYVEHQAKIVGEIEFSGNEYQIVPWSILRGPYGIMIDISSNFPVVKGVKLEKLVYNIYTRKTFPRAVTADLLNKKITYINDAFWKWEKGWEEDEEKLSKAREVYEVVKWLIDEKKFGLHKD